MGADFTPYQATIGVDFTYVENSIEDEDNPNKKNKISLQIWDTCNSKYKNIIFNYYKFFKNSGCRKIQSNYNITFEKCRWSFYCI